MQHISTSISPGIHQRGGGRVSSAELRQFVQMSEEFAGLEADTDRYDLLLLVKRTGKVAGFSPSAIRLLDYYMAFTRNEDWEEGARPIVFQSIAKTALDLGLSERQIQRLENELFEAKALTWNDSGNHRRYGQRCSKTGRILYAYGVDLTPLAFLKSELEAKFEEKQLYDRSWIATKREISFYRRQICAVLAEAEEATPAPAWHAQAQAKYLSISFQIRTHIDLAALRDLLATHKALYEEILSRIPDVSCTGTSSETAKESPPSAENVVHYNSTNQESFERISRPQANCFQESVAAPSDRSGKTGEVPKGEEEGEQPVNGDEIILGTGLQHITLKQALNAASERFKAFIPMEPRAMSWPDLIEAAYRLKSELHISQKNWAEACVTLGRSGAAVCLLLTDQGTQREVDPVRKPGAYFRAMIQRAKQGELHLHNSVFGILKRENEEGGSPLSIDLSRGER